MIVAFFYSSASDTINILWNPQLLQLKLAGKRMVQYGDDTWLKLFPDFFLRAEGTTSFFVADYTEVDNNVTRHGMPQRLLFLTKHRHESPCGNCS